MVLIPPVLPPPNMFLFYHALPSLFTLWIDDCSSDSQISGSIFPTCSEHLWRHTEKLVHHSRITISRSCLPVHDVAIFKLTCKKIGSSQASGQYVRKYVFHLVIWHLLQCFIMCIPLFFRGFGMIPSHWWVGIFISLLTPCTTRIRIIVRVICQITSSTVTMYGIYCNQNTPFPPYKLPFQVTYLAW